MKKNRWIYQVFIWTFFLSIFFSCLTNVITLKCNWSINIILIIVVIALGILFDMWGTSCLTSKESTFHAMAAKKIKGADIAVKMIKNNDKLASVCNDIVGDICGIISGGLGVVLAIDISNRFGYNVTIVTVIVSAIISSLTVGGKATFKKVAIKNSDSILYFISKVICFFKIK